MSRPLKPIEPKDERWEPTADPRDIVVPGLDTNAPINDQVEQIEQLITIKLQNIDANFSKIQQVMASRILPAVKRYAVGTEPVREAAKFWTTFFEQAAQIRVPTYDEYSMRQDTESEVEQEEIEESSTVESTTHETSERSKTFDPNRTSSEVSFAPGQAAISSTPARHNGQFDQDEPTPSWTASIESPLVRLDREIQSLTEDDQGAGTSSLMQRSLHQEDSQDLTERQINVPSFVDDTIQHQSSKGKGKASAEPLLRGILRRNVDASTATSRSVTGVSPLNVKQKTPNLKTRNPYLPPDTKPSDWKGVVDLTDPHVLTPGRRGASPSKRRPSNQSAGEKRPVTPELDDDDESFDVGLGMSPPIMMDFARPPQSRTPKLGRTPRKQAAERIVQNLVSTETRDIPSSTKLTRAFSRPGVVPSIESSISSVPSPPSLTKYSHHAYPSTGETSSSIADASLESMMRRVGLNVPGFGESHGSSASKADSSESYGPVPTSVFLPPSTSQSGTSQDDTASMPVIDFSRVRIDDDAYIDPNASVDSEDSFEEANNTANPSTAFMRVMQNSNFDEDDSFDSIPNDSIDFGDAGNVVHPHPFANPMVIREGDSFDEDDSFDDPVFDQRTEEETLFGVPPAQRIQAHTAYQQRMSSGPNLYMAGQDLLEDTLGVGAQRAMAGHVEETPTPWGGVREH